MSRLFLTGFMGTGKSAVGPLVARALGYTYVDLDKVIEQAARMSIPEIFEQEGEPAFRRRETEALKTVARRDRVVVATGGGVVVDGENRHLMAQTGHVVCLAATAAAIVRRTRRRRRDRPMLGQGTDLKARIEVLLAERAPFYRECHHMIDTTGRPVEAVAREVVRLHREGAWRG